MEQSPSWEINPFSASKEISCNVWNQNLHYHIYKCPPPVPILSQITSVNDSSSHFLKMHLNIFLPSMPGSSKWSFSVRLPHQNPVCTSPLCHMCYVPCLSHSFLFITRIIFGEEYRSLSSSLCSFLHSPVTSSFLIPNILLSTVFCNSLSLCYSLSMSDQVPHPHKTTGKIIVLYILSFTFFGYLTGRQKICTKW